MIMHQHPCDTPQINKEFAQREFCVEVSAASGGSGAKPSKVRAEAPTRLSVPACTHAAVDAVSTNIAVDVASTHTAVDAVSTNTAVDAASTHTAVDAVSTHMAVNAVSTHAAVDAACTHTAVNIRVHQRGC